MKATGIVRRIDGLGRIVIPKEIRRVLHIREGDPLEIYTSADGLVSFKKYSPMIELGQLSELFAASLAAAAHCSAAVCDRETVIAVSPENKRLLGRRLSAQLLEILDNRRQFDGSAALIEDDERDRMIICPVTANSELVGAVVIFSDKSELSQLASMTASLISGMLI